MLKQRPPRLDTDRSPISTLPVVPFVGAIVAATALGDADRGHQGDPNRTGANRCNEVAYAAVVDGFSRLPALAVGVDGEDDGVDPSSAAASVSGLVTSPTAVSTAGRRRGRHCEQALEPYDPSQELRTQRADRRFPFPRSPESSIASSKPSSFNVTKTTPSDGSG